MYEMMKILAAIQEDLNALKEDIYSVKKSKINLLKESWIDGEEVMDTLKISVRTLQNMRDKRELAFTKLSGKLYYKVEDIKTLLEKNYNGKK